MSTRATRKRGADVAPAAAEPAPKPAKAKAAKKGKAEPAAGAGDAGPAAAGAGKKETKAAPADREKFLGVFRQLTSELIEDVRGAGHPDAAVKWVTEMIEYNVPGGKLNRGLSVVDTLTALKSGKPLSAEDYFRAAALGWCIEWLQAFFLVADDIMDESVTRRGQPCWYKVPQVGMIAINDGIVLEAHIYRVLKRHFSALPCYASVLELFHEITYQTSMGQLLDLITAPAGKADLTKYTLETYTGIVVHKTAWYSFYLPVALAMRLAGVADPEAYKTAERVLIEMGTYFQIQDDVLDCYGAPEVIGKIGTDIEDSKCSWLVVTALAKASAAQEQKLHAVYGRKDLESVSTVKQIYKELKLQADFEAYETASYAKLSKAIAEQKHLPPAVFTAFLSKIYKRSK